MISTPLGPYDPDLQMFATPPRSPNLDHLLFLRCLYWSGEMVEDYPAKPANRILPPVLPNPGLDPGAQTEEPTHDLPF